MYKGDEFMYANKEKYLEYLIEKYADTVYRLAMARTRNKENAEDAFQEVFLRLSKNIPEFENDEHEKAWIIKVTINCSKNIFNAIKKQTLLLEKGKELEKEEIDEKDETYYLVQTLPIKYRTIIYLYYYEQYKIPEISKILKMNENTVKSILARGREKLKFKMKGGNFEE